MVEWNFSCLLKSGEYHTDNPEEDNVVSCYKNICRIEVFEFRCFVRPSKCGERPKCRTEPGIQSILILVEMCASTFRAFFRHFSCNDNFTALITVVSRDSVSPPELTGNAPITDIFQPVQICLTKACRNKFQFTRS